MEGHLGSDNTQKVDYEHRNAASGSYDTRCRYFGYWYIHLNKQIFIYYDWQGLIYVLFRIDAATF